MSEHIVRRYDEDLAAIKRDLLEMGGMVEKMIADAMRALVERNESLARQTITYDHQVNRKELEIDALAVSILAKWQPVARDLRFITFAMKINTDLERIGDTGVNICERAIESLSEPQLKPFVDLPRMAARALEMLKGALDAFVTENVEKANQIIESDSVIDDLYQQIFRELLTYMMADPKIIGQGLRLTFVAKYLERVADHATNICEMIKYLVQGQDVRHLRSQAEAK